MAITKFERWKTSEKNSDDLTKIGNGIDEKPVYEDESLAVQQLYDGAVEIESKLISTGANTTISFGDMVFTTDPKSGKTTTSIVMTVVHTDPSSSKVTTKTTTLSLT